MDYDGCSLPEHMCMSVINVSIIYFAISCFFLNKVFFPYCTHPSKLSCFAKRVVEELPVFFKMAPYLKRLELMSQWLVGVFLQVLHNRCDQGIRLYLTSSGEIFS